MRGHRLALAALLLAAAGCDTYYYKVPSPDDLLRAIPWFDHMVRAKYIHPYSRGDVPRQTVEGTGIVVNSSRAIIYASGAEDFATAAGRAAVAGAGAVRGAGAVAHAASASSAIGGSRNAAISNHSTASNLVTGLRLCSQLSPGRK